ncbi:hypothetical protein [Actinomadura kijaniata]|uniref:hypothetical protein n=1 Tax=Actinomadura kijaniata TaxID=46161 RepID=UPI000832275C|nr:hypothetical protein [Actinomadura kijaniata]
MSDDRYDVPHEVKEIDTATLTELGRTGERLRLNARLSPERIAAHVAADGVHHLLPLFWHTKPDTPRHLRCGMLLRMRTGERVFGTFDVLPEEFAPLTRVRPRERERDLAHRMLGEDVTTIVEWERARETR